MEGLDGGMGEVFLCGMLSGWHHESLKVGMVEGFQCDMKKIYQGCIIEGL